MAHQMLFSVSSSHSAVMVKVICDSALNSNSAAHFRLVRDFTYLFRKVNSDNMSYREDKASATLTKKLKLFSQNGDNF